MPAAAAVKVLLVDDQQSIRVLVRTMLRDLGFKDVEEVSNGNEALASLAARPVHLVISDYNMPGMDGLTLLRAVRHDPRTAKTAFVMLTGRNDKEFVQRAVQFGVNNFLVKPFAPATLRTKLEEVFGPLS